MGVKTRIRPAPDTLAKPEASRINARCSACFGGEILFQQRTVNGPRRKWIWVAAACVLLLVAGGIYWYATRTPSADSSASPGAGKGKGGRSAALQNVPVVVVPAKTGDIGVYLNGLGAVTPLATVTVKSRVDGQLMDVYFKEGQLVRQGELLALIDPRTYEAALLQAQGQMIRDVALLKNARIDLERYKTLFEQDSISQQQVATQESLVTQYEGTVKIDQAAIDTAKVNLVYCRITAPVSGRVGLRQVDPGNIVHAADTTGIVIITQLQPISVIFTLPEDNIPGVMKRLQAGEKLAVDAWDRAEIAKLAPGALLTMDNQVDPTTGTVKLRAQFPNQDFALFPSQFVNAHMLVETKHGVTLIPTAAIQRGTPGTFVYVVKPDSTVTVRPIKLGTTEADRAEVDSGVTAGENVVVDGADKLREGAKVEIATRDNTAGAKGKGGRKKGGDAAAAPAAGASAPASPAASATPGAPATPGVSPAPAAAGNESLTPEERKKRWEDLNARIDRGEFGEDIKKLPEEQRKQKMRELRAKRDTQAGPAKQ
jgi:multidrug efflux system membrane fusion protein